MTTEQPLAIEVCEETIEQHANGSITGVVSWNAADQSFPEATWNDFIVIVLCWWMRAVGRLSSRAVRSESFDFMDGPYSIACTLTDEAVVCEFIDRHDKPRAVGSCNTSVWTLRETLVQASELVLATCRFKGFRSVDIDLLQAEIDSCRNLRRGRG